MMNCPECGGVVERSATETEVAIGRRRVTLKGNWEHCVECEGVFFAPGEMDEAMRRASAIIRQRDGMLAPSEIEGIRRGMDATQAEFEDILGVGPKTVVRWERGTVVPNGATNTLLRVVRDVPEAAAYLRGVTRSHVEPVHSVTYRYASGPALMTSTIAAAPTVTRRQRAIAFGAHAKGVA